MTYGVRVGGVVLAYLAVAGTQAGAEVRLFHRVLPAFEGGNTQAVALNATGKAVGWSGVGMQEDFHAFISDQRGQLTKIEMLGFTRNVSHVVNLFGQTAGRCFYNVEDQWKVYVFRYTPGQEAVVIGRLSGYDGTVSAINARGDVAGSWKVDEPGSPMHAFLYTDAGGFRDLGAFGGRSSQATDLNDNGLLVGRYVDASNKLVAFLWEDEYLLDISRSTTDPVRINASGAVLATRPEPENRFIPIVHTPAYGAVPVPLPEGAISGNGIAISAVGGVTGMWVDGRGMTRAYRFSPGGESMDLGTLPGATAVVPYAINVHGDVVGHATLADNSLVPIFWSPETGIVDLRQALSPRLTWDKAQAIAINDAGWMIVSGEDDGVMKSAVLGPLTIGDMNCDGVINYGDVGPFALALSGTDEYRVAYPDCHAEAADANWDGAIDFGDVSPFVELLKR